MKLYDKLEIKHLITDLFKKLVMMYPDTFSELKIDFNGRYGTGICVEYGDIVIDLAEIRDMPVNMHRFSTETEMKEMAKYNKNITIPEYVLLHEIGHYLDFLENPKLFYENKEDKEDEMSYVNARIRESDFAQELYRTTILENRANRNAYLMARHIV